MAHLNIDGSSIKPGLHYDQTCYLVYNCNSIRTFLVITALHEWYINQIDYILFLTSVYSRKVNLHAHTKIVQIRSCVHKGMCFKVSPEYLRTETSSNSLEPVLKQKFDLKSWILKIISLRLVFL